MIKDYLAKTVFNDLFLENQKVYLKNQNINFMLNMIVSDFIQGDKSLFVVLPTLFEAQKCYDELTNMLDETNVLFFPADELMAVELLDIEGDFKYERINTLISLLDENKKYIVVLNFAGAIRYEMSINRLKQYIFTIDKNTIVNEKEMYKKLEEMGYKFSYTVTKTGEYSHRGSIIDIFPLNYDHPFRIDLFGDEIDTIKTFDQETQRSKEKVDAFTVIPVCELIYTDYELKEVSNTLEGLMQRATSDEERDKFNRDITNLNVRKSIDNMLRYIKLFDREATTILELVSNKKVYLIDYKKCEDNYEHVIRDLKNYCEDIGGFLLLELDYLKDFHYVCKNTDVFSEGVVDVFKTGLDFYTNIPEKLLADKAKIIGFLSKNLGKTRILLTIKNKIRLDHLKEDLLDENIYFRVINDAKEIDDKAINIFYDEYAPAFKSELANVLVLNEDTLFEIKYQTRKPKYKSIYKNTTKINRYDELTIGDYVVHFDYGIGRYAGLKTMENNGIKRDYIYLEYADSDALYIPLEQINSIEKYGSKAYEDVKISSLSSKSWSVQKAKAVKRIHEISQNLVRLYARRQASTGFEFKPDTEEQIALEADFGYELTPDQNKAIIEIKREMESPRVMDRLVCGDVGYGKTEVALRAAMKAVMSGKQVVVLAPTTILSRQHYLTFKGRMEKFGVRVDLLNRLQKPKKQKETLDALATGLADVVIGTHKLLGKSVKFHDLGLLIIDEEQRFGVMQKERIKELKVNIDTLTLSATPIPRTLQMSMVGIKELSMLETPPKNRYPIQTYVLERNDSIIRDAILRELARGGQVFYMYNLTDTIYDIENYLKSLVPEASFCVGHGKMEKDELENIVQDFIDKKYDVLVCTTIIETGIDMPDANTLIIHDASRLGLSQLYQLRGRVGRSDKIAYAYLMYEPKSILTETAEKRLETIKEFNQLGSGFKIAMRDLAIRGAGDFLGDSQSGFIESIGLETFLHILDEELKNSGEEEKKVTKQEVDVSLKKVYASRTISDTYINNEDVKIEIHKKIDKLKSLEDLVVLKEELIDRFGAYDEVIEVYMYEKLMSHLCSKLDIKKILDTKSQILLYMSQERSNKMDGNLIFKLATETSKEIELHYVNKQIEIVMNKAKFKENAHLIPLTTFLDKLDKNS